MATKQFDAGLISDLIQRCYRLSQLESTTAIQRAKLIELGDQLRDVLMRMLRLQFESNTQAFKDATSKVKEAKAELDTAIKELSKKAAAIKRVEGALGILGELLAQGIAFI